MTLELADGRGELFQWDTGRIIEFGEDAVSQAHFTNTEKVINIPYTVEVKNRKAAIPDELLQVPGKLIVYAWVSDTNGGYTKVQVNFPVFARPKPSDYVYTPTEHAGFDRLRAEIGDLSALKTNAKGNLVSAINEVAASGGSSGAVLYTEQLLSVEQENTARDNIKAFPRYQDLKHTNNAFIDIDGLTDSNGNRIAHGLLLGIQSSSMGKFQCKCIATDGKTYEVLINLANPSAAPTFVRTFSAILDADGNFPQQIMASAPTEDMQIATKKYVDDKECILQSTTPGSIKKFKITVDDSGALSAVEVAE